MGRISRIYHRSSINQLIFSVGIFVLIWINFTDGIRTFHLNETYLRGLHIFLFIGLTRIVDMGTGMNAQIIGTSNRWRFELSSGLILLLLTIPMNYLEIPLYPCIGVCRIFCLLQAVWQPRGTGLDCAAFARILRSLCIRRPGYAPLGGCIAGLGNNKEKDFP